MNKNNIITDNQEQELNRQQEEQERQEEIKRNQYRTLRNDLYGIKDQISSLESDLNNLSNKLISLLLIDNRIFEEKEFNLIKDTTNQTLSELNNIISSINTNC